MEMAEESTTQFMSQTDQADRESSQPSTRKRSKWENEDDEEEDEEERLRIRLHRERKKSKKLDSKGKAKSLAPPSTATTEMEIDQTFAGSTGSNTPRTPDPRSNSVTISREESLTRTTAPNTPLRKPPPKRPRPNPRSLHPIISGSRSVYCYERLNHIEEGTYGVVSRARDKETGEIVALKKLKMDQEKNGFPITSLREIRCLMAIRHENVVRCKEIVVGDTLTQIFIVFEFIEHDLKTLLSTMPSPFLTSEIKTLLLQLLSAIAACHDNWIVHRDLKTSNLLMNNRRELPLFPRPAIRPGCKAYKARVFRGQIKVADFGLARMYGDPLGDMTQLVVTLWYRAPELLLGSSDYSTAVDMWSIGCIFGELLQKDVLLPGKGEIDQLNRIFKLLGRPTEEIWPGFSKLPNAKSINFASIQPFSTLRTHFRYVTEAGIDLMSKLLCYDPKRRITAEEAMRHPYFSESPLPKHPDLFQSFPSIAAGEKRKFAPSPSAPTRMANKNFDLVLDFDI